MSERNPAYSDKIISESMIAETISLTRRAVVFGGLASTGACIGVLDFFARNTLILKEVERKTVEDLKKKGITKPDTSDAERTLRKSNQWQAENPLKVQKAHQDLAAKTVYGEQHDKTYATFRASEDQPANDIADGIGIAGGVASGYISRNYVRRAADTLGNYVRHIIDHRLDPNKF